MLTILGINSYSQVPSTINNKHEQFNHMIQTISVQNFSMSLQSIINCVSFY